MRRIPKHLNLYAMLATLVFGLSSFAGAPTMTTFQTRITTPAGTPLEAASVNFRFTVLDTVGTCALYVEDYTNVNMTASQGIATFSLGSGSRIYPAGAVSMHEVFNNSATSFPCQAGGNYSPGLTDRRQIVMQFNDGSGWQTLPQVAINSVFYSTYATRAEYLGSYPANDYLRPATLPTCTGTQAVTWDGTTFTCMTPAGGGGGSVTSVSGTSPISVATGSTTPVISISQASSSASGYLSSADWTAFNAKANLVVGAGKLYLGNASGDATGVTLSGDATLATSGVMTLANSGVTAGTYGSTSTIPFLTIDAKGRVTSASSGAYQDATASAKGIVQIGSNIHVSSGTISITSADVTGALGFTPANAASGVALSAITSATGSNTLANAANSQAWNWKLTGNTTAMTFGETTKSTGGSGNLQHIVDIKTLSTSTADPLHVYAGGTGIFAIGSDGAMSIGSDFPPTASMQQLSISGPTGDANANYSSPAIMALKETTSGDIEFAIGAKNGASEYAWLQSRSSISNVAKPLALNGAGGNVGIGTTSPSSALSVVGDINITGNYKVNGVNIGAGTGTVTGTGTPSKIVKFNTSSAITDSIMTESTSQVSVAGQINSTGSTNQTSNAPTIDFNYGNSLYVTSACAAFTLLHLVDGGSYSFTVQNTSGTCSFSSGLDIVHYAGGVSNVTITAHTVFSFAKMGTHVYVTWVSF